MTITQIINTGSDEIIDHLGYAIHEDVGTIATPIVITGGGGDVVLTNDGAGPTTDTTFLPIGVSEVWNKITNKFDWSQLNIGDMVDIRADIELMTSFNNTSIHIELELGSVGNILKIPFISGLDFKTAGMHHVERYNGFPIASMDIRDNGGEFNFRADKNCTVTVNSWYIKVQKK